MKDIKDNYTMKLTKREKQLIQGVQIGTINEVVKNIYSGVEVELTPEAVAIYDIILGCELSLMREYCEENEELFYAARDIFIRNWPQHYSTLID